jgi:phosphoglycolate phosphatase
MVKSPCHQKLADSTTSHHCIKIMSDFPFDLVGFDLDGTLVDTSGDLTAATNHALALAGRPSLTQEMVKTMIGGGAKLMLQKGLEISGGISDDEFRPLYKEMLRYYGAHVSAHSRPFPGAVEMLDTLDRIGVRYAVVTNKFESLARQLLTDLGLADRMVCILGADTLGTENAKPSPALIHEMIRRNQVSGGGTRTVYVGDSSFDVIAAKNASIPSVAVSFGFLHGPVEELNADAIINHFDDLITTLQHLPLTIKLR